MIFVKTRGRVMLPSRISSVFTRDYITQRNKFDMIYLLTAIGLSPGGSSTVQYTFTHKQYQFKPIISKSEQSRRYAADTAALTAVSGSREPEEKPTRLFLCPNWNARGYPAVEFGPVRSYASTTHRHHHMTYWHVQVQLYLCLYQRHTPVMLTYLL
jgi:hypothetical protein